MSHIEDLIKFLCDEHGYLPSDISWWSWPETFGSTSGPRGGFGGQMMTRFQVFAFETPEERIKYCAGIWKKWNGDPNERW